MGGIESVNGLGKEQEGRGGGKKDSDYASKGPDQKKSSVYLHCRCNLITNVFYNTWNMNKLNLVHSVL